ncbi:putative VV D11-like helicase [Namao virus]|nr:putative VV D11-like helicase [Namao virus]
MSENNDKSNYPNLKMNGRLFTLWILQNFKKYKIPLLKIDPSLDPCKQKEQDTIKELHIYQKFLASYLDYKSVFTDILIYHGLGSGKTASAINIYNMLYNYNPNWNIYIIIKASLKNDPWMRDLEDFLQDRDKSHRMSNIRFIHYDSPKADRDFIEAVKSGDIMKKNLYIIDEVHNFIKNVYNNITNKQGKRAFIIYDYINKEKKTNESSTRIILISGTPAVNNAFEIALIYNLLRPDIFPNNEMEFNEIYVSKDKDKKINLENKNMFQRRIMGLTSYYAGSTSDLFARKIVYHQNIEMSDYQTEIYKHYDTIEKQLQKRSGPNTNTVYRAYTRQACNFVFPLIDNVVNGENRPRPGKFRLTESDAQRLLEARAYKDTDIKSDVHIYLKMLETYVISLDHYYNMLHKKDERGIQRDIEIFKTKYDSNFDTFWKECKTKSKLLVAMYENSCKMVALAFNTFLSKGPVLIYSNYVKMEGIEVLKIYLKYFGYVEYSESFRGLSYIEFHGDVPRDVRTKRLEIFNRSENKFGDMIKVIFLSPAGSEGISLKNVRQVHILEPYWNEVRIIQVIGRAVRQCSHSDLPQSERYVDIYRYYAVFSEKFKNETSSAKKTTTDEEIYALANVKHQLIDSFLESVREVAVDCELFKNVNMLDKKYNCFKFSDDGYFGGYVAPAYQPELYYDKKLDDGLNSTNSQIKTITVYKIKAVKKTVDSGVIFYSEISEYWYNPDTGIVYDLELEFPMGKIYKTEDVPSKLNKDVYIIDESIDIPQVQVF